MKALFAPALVALTKTVANTTHGGFEYGVNQASSDVTFNYGVKVSCTVTLDGVDYTIKSDQYDDYTVTDENGNTLSFDEESGVTTFTDGDGKVVKRVDADGDVIDDAGEDEVAEAEAPVGDGDAAAVEGEVAEAEAPVGDDAKA